MRRPSRNTLEARPNSADLIARLSWVFLGFSRLPGHVRRPDPIRRVDEFGRGLRPRNGVGCEGGRRSNCLEAARPPWSALGI